MVSFTLRQCRHFLAVADQGVLARAARELNLSEAALAASIGKMEALLGVRLFERFHARGVRLTMAGRSLHPLACQLLDAAGNIERMAGALARDEAGQVRLGCFQTIAPFILPGIVRRIRARFPLADLVIREENHHQLAEGLLAHAFDLAILYGMGELDEQLAWHRLTTLRPYAVLPANHPLAGEKRLELAALARYPFVLFDLPGSADYFATLFAEAGLQPDIAFRSQSLESVRSMVANGLGVSVLVMRPVWQQSYDGQDLVCVPLDPSVPSLDILAAWNRETAPAGLRQDILQILECEVAEAAPLIGWLDLDAGNAVRA